MIRNNRIIVLRKGNTINKSISISSVLLNARCRLVEDWTLKRHISIGVFVVYIDTRSPVLYIPSKSRDLADENNKILTEWLNWAPPLVVNPYFLRSGDIIDPCRWAWHLRFQRIQLFRIISIPSKFCYFRPPDHVISMECKALVIWRCQGNCWINTGVRYPTICLISEIYT
jgi:hypothetical protein